LSEAAAWPQVREYRLRLALDFAAMTFAGSVEIDLEGASDRVVLNASELEITSVSSAGRPLPWTARAASEELEITHVTAGAPTLRLEFRGRASTTALSGLYRSTFGSEYLLTTQCAPIGARHVFPCIDRPDRKAPIRFELTIAEGLDAVFNTPVESEERADGHRTFRFAPTPAMATYLFYLGVGRFDVRKGPVGRVQVAVYAPKGRGDASAYALRYAGEFLAAFERYFGIDYPLPKLDLIAVPQYAYGAMENWGAIVFRDMYLLIDEATSTRNKRWGLDTIAHEIAHQWFGNLVTMEWWDDIWLNESFATFLEMRIITRVDPSLGSLDNYLAYWIPQATLGDSLPHTHPVTTEVTDPSQIVQVFDEISYGKGSAILRMVESFVGEEPFRAGVNDFLEKFRYGNARSVDLWEALDRHAHVPVRPLLEEWTARPGHPLLSVAIRPGSVAVRQRRFALDGRHTEEHWPIPLSYAVNGTVERRILHDASATIPVPPLTSLHLNPGAVGFYRTLYDDTGYDLLLRSNGHRTAIDRWNVLHDLGSFLYSGDCDWDRYARFVAAEATATDHLPVREIADSLLGLWLVLGDLPELTAIARPFLARQFERLGPRRKPGEPETDGILRERMAAAVVWADPKGAKALAEAYDDVRSVDSDLRGSVATAKARFGGRAMYDELGRILDATAAEGEASDYELALASFDDPALVRATFDRLDTGGFNRAHLPVIVRRAAWNPVSRDATWSWMQRHLEEVAQKTKGTGFSSYVLEYALPYVGLERPDEVRAWIGEHPVTEGGRGARKGLGLLDAHLALRRRLGPH